MDAINKGQRRACKDINVQACLYKMLMREARVSDTRNARNARNGAYLQYYAGRCTVASGY